MTGLNGFIGKRLLNKLIALKTINQITKQVKKNQRD